MAELMNRQRFSLNWQVSRSDGFNTPEEAWIPAQVPGAVQLDWAKAHNLPDYWIGNNISHWQKLDESPWTYRTRLEGIPSIDADKRLFLVLEGVDYQCEVRIDEQQLHSQEGLETPIHLDVTDYAREGAVVTVHIAAAPKSRAMPENRAQADHSCKPAVSYGWDFHPRLIPLGLWRDAYLEVRSHAHFARRPEVEYRLNESCTRVTGALRASLAEAATETVLLRWTLKSPDGEDALIAEIPLPEGQREASIPFAFNVRPDDLWWPHDQGLSALHRSEVELVSARNKSVLDQDARTVGFRRIKLTMAPGEWEKPAQFPKSRSRPPMTLEINGRAIFAKGSNWVGPDVFPGTLTRERYHALLDLAREANFNFLRVWGGANAPHDAFYERCDELGIMVWQEFPLACNLYPDDGDYLSVLDQESRSLIERLRGFPSLVLWCGGNELFNAWSKMTDQSLPLRLLNRNTYELDPARPFLATAPVEGMGHGHYTFRDPLTGEEAWAAFQRSDCTAYSEFGCPGPASVETLERIIPKEELWPPRPGTAWELHHAFGSWLPGSWLHLTELEQYFGPCNSLEELVERGQLLQAVGFQGLFEEARRQKPTAGMALNWCFTEPWPCAANNSLITWPCEPKPALATIADSCRPTLASARIRKFSWEPGDCFDPEIWLLHDGPLAHNPVTVKAWLEIDGRRQALLSWDTEALSPNQNLRGPRIQVVLPAFESPLFKLHLEVSGQPEWNSSYPLVRASGEALGGDSLPQPANRPRTNF